MRNDLVEVVVVGDRSGSMYSIVGAATSGFKEFVRKQSQESGDVHLTLYTFDDHVEKVLDRVDLKDKTTLDLVETNTNKWFEPRGMTALYDALARAINDIGARLANTPEPLRPGKVIVVGITDGQENSSREVNINRLRDMISTQTNKYSWQFVFIGTNQDAILTGRQLGISADSALSFAANDSGTLESYRALSKYTSRVRHNVAKGANTVSEAFTSEEREAALDVN